MYTVEWVTVQYTILMYNNVRFFIRISPIYWKLFIEKNRLFSIEKKNFFRIFDMNFWLLVIFLKINFELYLKFWTY